LDEFLRCFVPQGNVSGPLTRITNLDQFTCIAKDMWPVESSLENFLCGGGDAMMSSGWSAVTLLKNLCCFISGHASSDDSVSTLFE
ncbi:hypothetical protein Tco_0470593, partial [Tanacetum coccineum]